MILINLYSKPFFKTAIICSSGGQANTQIGTINYLAPEICDGQYYDSTSDVWALGCILYEMCALERMFDGAVSLILVL